MRSCTEPQDPGWVSICPRCFREVSNRAYFAGAKGSAHLKGTCSPSPCATKEDRIPERTYDKPRPYPMPSMPTYKECRNERHKNRSWTCGADCPDRIYPVIQTYDDLAKWWGLDKKKGR